MPEQLSVHEMYFMCMCMCMLYDTGRYISEKNQAFEMLYVIHGQSVESSACPSRRYLYINIVIFTIIIIFISK